MPPIQTSRGWVDSNTGNPVPPPMFGPYTTSTAMPRSPDNPFPQGSRESEKYEKEKRKNLIAQAGMPKAPKFEELGTAVDASGVIKDQYRLKPGQVDFQNLYPQISENVNRVNIDQRAMDAIRERALGAGESPWLKLQLEKQGMEEKNALDKVAAQGAGNRASAESNLAMRGGLSSGARERLARSSATSDLLASQDVRNQGAGNRLGLQIAEDATKTDLLKALPGMDASNAQFELGKQQYLGNAATQQQGQDLASQQFNVGQNTAAQQYNINNSLNELLQKRGYDVNQYNQQMKAWAAGKTADAQGSGGKK